MAFTIINFSCIYCMCCSVAKAMRAYADSPQLFSSRSEAVGPDGSNIHATGSCRRVQAMTKGGAAQGYLPAKGKPIVNPALNVNNSAQQPTASASQMAARTVVTARKSATSALQTRDTERRSAVYATTSVDSHDENEHYELATSCRKKLKIRQRERKQQLQQCKYQLHRRSRA